MELWEKLKTSKNIILYGMGNGAEKIIDYCKIRDIKIKEIMASDLFVRGQEFRGYKVKSLDEIKKLYNNFIILVGFATRESEVIKHIAELDRKYELYIPDVPVYGKNIFNLDFFNKNRSKIEEVYNFLADDKSREVYKNIIQFKLTGKLEYLHDIESEKEEAFELLELKDDEVYIDAGAYTGDTIQELLDYTKSVKKIYTFEPDIKNHKKLEKNIDNMNIGNKCVLFNCGLWNGQGIMDFSSENSRNSSFVNEKSTVRINIDLIDNLVKENITYIKYDVEGSEYEALDGSIKTINKYKPKLAVSLYHRSEDIFKLPLFIKKINKDYKLYIRKHKYIPSWDINLYCKT